MNLNLRVNGASVKCEAAPADRLLDVLRREGFTGVKEGCGEGECGACSVLLDGRLVNSCLVPALQAEGPELLTIEGVDSHPVLAALRTGFHRQAGAQCGICTPGMMLAAAALLLRDTRPDEDAIREALAGNLCRCTGYVKIVDSVLDAAAQLREGAA